MSTLSLVTYRDGDSTTYLGNLFQCLIMLCEEISPDAQTEPPLVQLETVPLSCCSFLGEESDSHQPPTSFQGVAESGKVTPDPPLLQAK